MNGHSFRSNLKKYDEQNESVKRYCCLCFRDNKNELGVLCCKINFVLFTFPVTQYAKMDDSASMGGTYMLLVNTLHMYTLFVRWMSKADLYFLQCA